MALVTRRKPAVTRGNVEGSFASVFGGAPAAAVVLTRDVRARAAADERVIAAESALAEARDPAARLRPAIVDVLDRAAG